MEFTGSDLVDTLGILLDEMGSTLTAEQLDVFAAMSEAGKTNFTDLTPGDFAQVMLNLLFPFENDPEKMTERRAKLLIDLARTAVGMSFDKNWVPKAEKDAA